AYILEEELPAESEEDSPVPIFCGWQNHYDTETRLCDFWLSIFLAWEGEQYKRYDEHQIERCYTHDEIRKALTENGFELIDTFGGYDFSAPASDAHRWYFVARAVPGNTAQQVILPNE
ncbi:MAG: hypothetical protein J6B77_01290, partial [Clostridia bacterium]|nr:hypothetical protein [Clostridia bacterium]